MNPESSLEYLQALGKRSPVWNRYHTFDAESQRLLFMTRQFAKLSIDRKRYSDVFGADVMSDYGSELDVLAEMKLIDITPSEIRLTTRGMFFSDTVGSVLSYGRHVRKLGRESAERVSRNGNQGGHM